MSKKNKYGLDQFYTKPNIAKKCLDTLNLQEYDTIIEPSAGEGVFFHMAEHENKIGYDLEPKSDDIEQCDFLVKDLNFIGGVSVWRYTQDRTLTIDFSNRSYSDLTMDVYFERAVFNYRGGEIRLRTSTNTEEMIKLPINRTQNFSRLEFDENLGDVKEPDGVSQTYSAIDKSPNTFTFESYLESTRQIIYACISSSEARRITPDEVLANELRNHDWRIS